MKKIDVTSYMTLGLILRDFIDTAVKTDLPDVTFKVSFLRERLEAFVLANDLTVCRKSADDLLENLRKYEHNYKTNYSLLLSLDGSNSPEQPEQNAGFLNHFSQSLDIQSLKHGAEAFNTLLLGELPTKPTYIITSKLAYKIEDLIDYGDKILPDSTLILISKESRNDIKMATRCYSFELGTATAFHLMRATESVIKEYYKIITGHLPKVKQRDWGAYLRNLRKYNETAVSGQIKADEKILLQIEYIKDHHRNPVIHPEESLTNDEAGELIGIIQGFIGTLAKEIKRIKK